MKLVARQRFHVKDLESLQNTLGWLVSKVRVTSFSPLPLAILLHLTRRCNLNCRMCKQALGSDGSSNQYQDEMSIEQWKACIDNIEASFRRLPRIHLTGGEPTVHRGFPELLRYTAQRGFKVSLTSNGLRLAESAQALVNLGVRDLNVSVHGPESVHDTVTGLPGSFSQAMESIGRVRAYRERRGSAAPQICVNSVISGDTFDHLEQTIVAVRESGADALTLQHLIFSSGDLSDASFRIDAGRLRAAISRIKRHDYGLRITFYPDLTERQLEPYYGDLSHDFGAVCVAPWFIMRIAPNGDVLPCLGRKCGNVRVQPSSLRDIWNNSEFRAFRRELKSGLGPGCVRCCHRQYL